MIGGPFATTLDTGNLSVCEKSHFVITNVQQLATNPEKWLHQFSRDFFDMIIVDEAHHSPADSWRKVHEHFKDARVINMTATPFRGDAQEIEGDLVYRYPFKKATFKGYIKRITASYAAPTELEFTAKGETKIYTLNEVLAMKEKDWFSRGIALSEPCNQTIVDNSLQRLEQLRETGTAHQLIAVACTVDHARKIVQLYEARGFKADLIYSEMDEDKKTEVKRRLTSGELDCIVQVQMLGEGFDHPKLSVAAIFRPFRTLAPYIQFVGRILRVIVQNSPGHPDNYGHIVTHAGMNLDERLREFKLFESDDQKFWEEVIGGKEPEPPANVKSGTARMRLAEQAVVNYEIVDTMIEEQFTSAEQEDIIKELREKLESLGLDPEQAEAIVLSKDEREDDLQGRCALPSTPAAGVGDAKEGAERAGQPCRESPHQPARDQPRRTGTHQRGRRGDKQLRGMRHPRQQGAQEQVPAATPAVEHRTVRDGHRRARKHPERPDAPVQGSAQWQSQRVRSRRSSPSPRARRSRTPAEKRHHATAARRSSSKVSVASGYPRSRAGSRAIPSSASRVR